MCGISKHSTGMFLVTYAGRFVLNEIGKLAASCTDR